MTITEMERAARATAKRCGFNCVNAGFSAGSVIVNYVIAGKRFDYYDRNYRPITRCEAERLLGVS